MLFRSEKKQVEAAYRTIVVSTAMKDYLIRKTGIDPSRIVVTANAVNPHNIAPNLSHCVEIRNTYSIQPDQRVIGFVGSIFPYHGVDLLIESFASLCERFSHIRLLIVGDGAVLPGLRKRVEELKLSSRISFTGNVPHAAVYDYQIGRAHV